MSEQEQIESVLANLERPSYVTELRYVLDDDWSGDPAIRIWVILRDEITERREILEYTKPVRSTITQALRNAEVDRWPYVHFRGQSEQAELDRADRPSLSTSWS